MLRRCVGNLPSADSAVVGKSPRKPLAAMPPLPVDKLLNQLLPKAVPPPLLGLSPIMPIAADISPTGGLVESKDGVLLGEGVGRAQPVGGGVGAAWTGVGCTSRVVSSRDGGLIGGGGNGVLAEWSRVKGKGR